MVSKQKGFRWIVQKTYMSEGTSGRSVEPSTQICMKRVLKYPNPMPPGADLIDQKSVTDFFEAQKPDYVFLASAGVGGILANNTYRTEFIWDNLCIQSNVIHQSSVAGVKKQHTERWSGSIQKWEVQT